MGIRQARSSFLSLAERKKRSKERAAATRCVHFEIIPSAGSLKLALRASDSQAPDSDLLRRPLSSANWRSHTQRVPDIADLSFGWNGFGIFDAVLRLRLGMWKRQGPFSCCAGPSPRGRLHLGKSFLSFFCLYGPGGPEH